MIEIKNLVKRYGDFAAVNDISFSIEDGEIVGFLGPNGAGKTTTMSILTGCLSMTSGSVVINGVDIFENPLDAKKQIGYLPEFPPLYLEMTVREYLNFVYELKSCTLDREKHLDEISERVKLSHVSNRIIKNLSKGYRQRVGIAQALIGNPKVIIFDEPTVGLDPKQIIEIRSLIRDLGRDHTVILSTHILPEVQMVCDRIVIINRGKIVADEKTEDIEKVVASVLKNLKADVVCANYDFDGTVLEGLVEPYTILKKAGKKIGIIGLLTDISSAVDANIAKSLQYQDPGAVTSRYAEYLKNEKGCDMVICLSHLGYGEDKDLASQVRNVDLIVGGHTHTLLHKKQLVKNPDGEDVVVVQNWKWGLNVGHLTIDF